MSNVYSTGNPDSVRVPKTAELVARHIRRQIVLHQLHEGDALPPESALMEEFSISRPTLREAFRILESEGLITVRRGARGGARVLEPSAEVAARYAGLVLQHRATALTDVLEARAIVEGPAAGILAGRRNRKSSADRLQELLDSTDPAEPGRFHDFNALLVELTGNQTLILLTAMLEHISRAATIHYPTDPEDEYLKLARKAQRSRQKVINHIRDGDADAAEELWRTHLVESGEALAARTGEKLFDLFS